MTIFKRSSTFAPVTEEPVSFPIKSLARLVAFFCT
uniref:Uncharacterized protein n=1 Tax=Arundo donax TaxID=35708 RepID=A0A0A9EW19_ARUDO